VIGIERHEELARGAAAVLAEIGADNVEVLVGDGSRGYPGRAPYGAIAVHAAAPEPPPTLIAQLAEGGRLVVPVAGVGGDELIVLRRRGEAVEREAIAPCRFVPLIGEEGF
jgi:protein-L-isoaspartate(D-aspartate) O-methyltransferase